jgi:hypothetical protein
MFGTHHKDGEAVKIDIIRVGNLTLDSVLSLIELKLIRSFDSLSSKGGLLSLQKGSETGELGQSFKRDI